jgi:DNA mismatch endonuclease (patch repair protein)
MRGNRGKNTSPELRLRRLLREAGHPGYRLHSRDLPGHPDIAYPGKRLAIFVHGCFWHRCPACQPSIPKSHGDFWKKKFELNVERDAKKRQLLEQLGWRVIVVWECRLAGEPDAVVRDIEEALLEAQPVPRSKRY